METRLQWLESLPVHGNDGHDYVVRGYERLARFESTDGLDRWESTGIAEYRLADGRPVQVDRAGTMRIADSDVTLSPQEAKPH
jgi:hypothetical protein